MAAFRFIGDPRCGGHGPASIALFGKTFTRTEWTEVEDDLADRCARHSHLEARLEPVEAAALYVRRWATHDDESASAALSEHRLAVEFADFRKRLDAPAEAPRKRGPGRPRKVV